MAIEKESVDTPNQHEQNRPQETGKKTPESQIHSFIQKCNEDVGFTTANLHELAHLLGVQDYQRINSEVELIREIQKAAQNRPCFRSNYREYCLNSECQWKTECKKIIAEWLR